MSRLQPIEHIGQTPNGSQVKLFYNRDESEYIVRIFRNGKLYAPADYFTDDKQDAILTGQNMLKEESARNDRITCTNETLLGCFAPEFADNLREAFRPSFKSINSFAT
jgi:hypothetical protein